MWLYTAIGFFSIVQKNGDEELSVLARVRADLERLKHLYIPSMSAISETVDTDYRFRGRVSHAAFADAAYHIALGIDYPNFKDAIAERSGTARANVYANVWAATLGLSEVPDQMSAEDQNTLPVQVTLTVPQRLMMRALYEIHEYEALRTWRCLPFYAVSEKLGLVERESNQHQTSAEEYAKALGRDGLNKGWITEPLSADEWHRLLSTFVYRFLVDGATFRNGEPWINRT